MKKRIILAGLIIVVCAGIAVGLWISVSKSEPVVPKTQIEQSEANTAFYTYNGNISSENLQNCVSFMALELKRIYVREGTYVKKGDLLYLLDDSDTAASLSQARAGIQLAQANLEKAQLASETTSQIAAQSAYDSAEAAYNQAKNNLERLTMIQEMDGVSQSDFEKAQMAVVTAEAQYKQAKVNYDTIDRQSAQNVRVAQAQLAQARAVYEAAESGENKRKVTAEINGVVADIWAHESNMLSAGQKIMDIVDYDNLILEIYVDQFEIPLFSIGEEIPVYVNPLNLSVNGKVSGISNQAIKTGEASGFKVTVDLEKNPALRIGLIAEIKKNVQAD